MSRFLSLFLIILLISCEKITPEQDEKDQNQQISDDIQQDYFACTLYDGHVVAYSNIYYTDSVQLTLISLQEWTDLPSANNASYPDVAIQYANTYQEGNFTDWHIPTVEEAKNLMTYYSTIGTLDVSDSTIYNNGFHITISSDSTQLSRLNTLFANQNAEPITLVSGNENARYLCDGAIKSFSFVTGTTISKAGAKSTNYRLRLLKAIRIHTN